jgi:Ni/Fe-hydrogenase subunit HybB-like protein
VSTLTERNGWLKDILWVAALAGAVAIGFRLWFGLGATTNLSDAVPWGLWKILNMVAGVALATSGFTVGFLVYVLRLERFRPLLKPAILLAFLGYGSSCFALFLDIGLPHRIWHPIVMWNPHSFLFEVAWCVMLYFTITMLELSPTVLERVGGQRMAHRLHRAAFWIVTVGITLSSLHHTSLGSLFLVTPQRLHPLWYTPMLPVHFILSAMGGGLMVVVLAKLLHSHWYDREAVFGAGTGCGGRVSAEKRGKSPCVGPEFPMVRQLATLAAGILAVALLVKLADLGATGAWRALLAGTWESWFYGFEILLGAAIPVLLMASSAAHGSPALVGAAAASAALGLAWNRLNVGIFGYFRDAGTVYVPSLAEWAVSLGVMAAAAMVFFFAAENLPIFSESAEEWRRAHRAFTPAFDRFSGVWRMTLAGGVGRASLLAVIVVPLAWVLLFPPFRSGGGARGTVRPPVAQDAERRILRIDGDGAGVAVVFPHADHQRRLGGRDSCARCHHLSLPADHSTPCSRCHRSMEQDTDIFDHDAHLTAVARRDHLGGWIPANQACGSCHSAGGPKGAATARPCLECHQKDMAPSRQVEGPLALGRAPGYRVALHENCVACHESEAAKQGRPTLGDCSTCHETLRRREVPTATASPSLVAARLP